MNNEIKSMNIPRDHNFDGIQEYDNDMPQWWVWLFILTIIFSIGYLAWYHTPGFPSKSLAQEYEEALARDKLASLNSQKKNDNFDLNAAIANSELTSKGKKTFGELCMPCHAENGGGGVGPNLTDANWIHGGSFPSIEKVISAGVLDKGMPTWIEVLGPEKVREVAVFVMTLKNTNVPGGKEPQGEPYSE